MLHQGEVAGDGAAWGWQAHTAKMVQAPGHMYRWPAAGANNDNAHPPIHPTQYAPPGALQGLEKRVYEFICRSFLACGPPHHRPPRPCPRCCSGVNVLRARAELCSATQHRSAHHHSNARPREPSWGTSRKIDTGPCRCCSQDAIGFQTSITAQMAQEEFTASGLMVLERNWLDVYTYTTWGGTEVPPLQPGQTFAPRELALRAGQTEPPPKLSERDLLSLMDRFGIGTDATVSSHIANQLVRFGRALRLNRAP